MTRTRRILIAAAAAGAALTACTAATDGEPTDPTARPVIEEPDISGQPGRLAADEALRDAVRGIAPWLVRS